MFKAKIVICVIYKDYLLKYKCIKKATKVVFSE